MMDGPMAGVRVVEVGFWVAAPAAAAILSDWGAEVVKIEPSYGDPMRGLAGAGFGLDNRGKRGVVLDLNTERGREVALSLVDRADVFVTNMRPVILEGWAMDYPSLAARNPRLVYSGVTGYGMDGPERDRPSYDYGAYWARSGLAASLVPEGAEHPPIQRGGMGDHMTALATVGAIAAALYARDRTGRGQFVGTSLFRTAIYQLGLDTNAVLRLTPEQRAAVPARTGSPRSMSANPLFCPHHDSEGRWFWLLCMQPHVFWPRVARAVGHPEWAEDERFATFASIVGHAKDILAMLGEILPTRTLAEWGPVFDEHDVWWAPVQTILEMVEDPQAAAAGAFVNVPTDEGDPVRMVASPADFSDTASRPRRPVPELGQHTEEVLLELGLDWHAIVVLKDGGVIP